MQLTGTQQQATERLLAGAAENRIFWSDDGRIPKFIVGRLSAPSQEGPEAIARAFMADNQGLFALDPDMTERLELNAVERDRQGHTHVCLAQFITDIAVHEGSVQVHIDEQGVVTAYKDNRLAAAAVELQPGVSEESAVRTALADIGRGRGEKHASQLCLYRQAGNDARLAWRIEIAVAGEHGPRIYFIDAHDGAILYRFSESRAIMARMTYSAGNQQSLPGILVIRDDEQCPDAVVQAAHDNAREVYDYYLKTFGRDSYDNQGSPLISTVHFGQRYNNAYWNNYRRQMVYGDGDGVEWLPLAQALDIVGHEFTHAITSCTARFVYAEESGALDEAFADFFGVMIANDQEITDWLMGEGVYTPYRSGDALRDLADPARFGLPDHMERFMHLRPGELPDAEKNDMGWLHFNCGIPAKAAYLTVAGGTHHGIRVEGLGRQKAEQIYYLALTEYMRSATLSRWTFKQARYAALNACRQLYGETGPEYAVVQNSWAAVGVGEPAGNFALITREASPALAIPDNDPQGVASAITVEEEGIVREVTVFVMIHHSYINDLRVRLVSPGGEEVVLHDRRGGAEDDLIEEYRLDNAPELLKFVGDAVQGDWRLLVSDHAAADTGSLVEWGFTLAVEKLARQTVTAAAAPELAIADNDPRGIESRIRVAGAGVILHLDATVDVSHTWIGDLQLVLVDPAGRETVLHNRSGSSRHDLKKTYSTRTDEALRPLIGAPLAGDWALRVADLAGQDTGILHGWKLDILYSGS
jgi:Zn-dependent metalloprotease/subtilisin-like proprotein convertase family protein